MATTSTSREWEDTDQARLVEMHAQGFTRNAIARELGRSGATISRYAAEAGLSFDREQVKAATNARRADVAALRSELELQLLEDAQALRAQIWQPHTYIDHGGKDFLRVEWTQNEPSPVDKLKLMQAAGNAVDRAIRLGELDKGGEVEEARSMLVALFEDLGKAFRGQEAS